MGKARIIKSFKIKSPNVDRNVYNQLKFSGKDPIFKTVRNFIYKSMQYNLYTLIEQFS